MYQSNVNKVLLNAMVTDKGKSVSKLSEDRIVLLVFLRHFGCVFCKEALNDLAERYDNLKLKGVIPVFVHMAEHDVAEQYFKNYKLPGADHISDPNSQYYAAFGLTKGKISQLYGLQTWIRGFDVKKQGYKLELARSLGDATQMPGIFVIHEKEIKDQYIHKIASDRPDYDKLLRCCVAGV